MFHVQHNGYLEANRAFASERGIRQGHFVSGLFFNAGLELALARRNGRTDCGLHVGRPRRLTTLFYAGDLLCAQMLVRAGTYAGIPCWKSHGIGLILNPPQKKKKMFTPTWMERSILIQITPHFLEVVPHQESHKYIAQICGQSAKWKFCWW